MTRQVGRGPTRPAADYFYNGAGDRVRQIDYVSGTTTEYTNDILGMTQVLLTDDGTTTTANLFGLDLISQDDGRQTRFLLTDGLGSARTEIVGGAVETTTTYEPYGRPPSPLITNAQGRGTAVPHSARRILMLHYHHE
ncbi:MAG: hypothetical protein IAE79_00640 [Anaerolinea sp.]|nr:hypothetical protein [Anaerolinea sp.]